MTTNLYCIEFIQNGKRSYDHKNNLKELKELAKKIMADGGEIVKASRERWEVGNSNLKLKSAVEYNLNDFIK